MSDYRERSEVNQSSLKTLLIHPSLFGEESKSKLYFEEKDYFIIGNGVDIQLTQGLEEFNRVFYCSELENKPSDTLKSIVNMLFDKELEVSSIDEIGDIKSSTHSTVVSVLDAHSYQPRWKEETRLNKVWECCEYWEDLKRAFGKTIITVEEKNKIDSIVMSLRSSEATGKYFTSNGNIELEFQKEVYFTYEGVECKALLDVVRFDHANKKIYPLDVKTMSGFVSNFPSSLRKRRYDIQAAFYTKGLMEEYPGYTIENFKFLVESTTHIGNPAVFTCTEDLLHIGEHGLPELVSEGVVLRRSTKGFKQLIEEYKYYSENGFDITMELKMNGGEIEINW